MSIPSTDQVRKLEFSFEQWREKFVRTILYVAAGIGLLGLIPYVLSESNRIFIGTAIGFYIILLLFTFLRIPYLFKAGFFSSLFFLISVFTLLDTGIQGEANLFFLGFVIISSIIISPRSGWYALVISLVTYAIIAFFVLTGRFDLLTSTNGPGATMDWVMMGIYQTLLCTMIVNAIRLTQREFRLAHEQSDAMLAELNTEHASLEARISERTAELNQGKTDLELANRINAHRAAQFEAISLVTRAIVSLQNSQEMLTRVAEAISRQFNFYHVGIFMIDQNAQYAILTATNSLGGKKMLEKRHRVDVGKAGLVGQAASTKKPQLFLASRKDIAFFDNPDLAETQSEIALPLQAGTRLIGILDLQSREPNAFAEDDLSIFSILADQIAIAIQNARLYENSQKLLEETRKAAGAQLRDAWEEYRSTTNQIGYRTSANYLEPLDQLLSSPQIERSMETGQAVVTQAQKGQLANMAIPITLRGQTIGVMNLQSPARDHWDQDNIDIAQAVAERLSIAIENATLIETSQRRAALERTIGDITAKIGSSINLKNILQTAVEELGQTLPMADVVIQFQNKE